MTEGPTAETVLAMNVSGGDQIASERLGHTLRDGRGTRQCRRSEDFENVGSACMHRNVATHGGNRLHAGFRRPQRIYKRKRVVDSRIGVDDEALHSPPFLRPAGERLFATAGIPSPLY